MNGWMLSPPPSWKDKDAIDSLCHIYVRRQQDVGGRQQQGWQFVVYI